MEQHNRKQAQTIAKFREIKKCSLLQRTDGAVLAGGGLVVAAQKGLVDDHVLQCRDGALCGGGRPVAVRVVRGEVVNDILHPSRDRGGYFYMKR